MDEEIRNAKKLLKENGYIIIKAFQHKAVWKIWSGWRGNHDMRIEYAECSNCGYIHSTVKDSLSSLSRYCSNCGAKINEVKYEYGEIETIKRSEAK